MEKLEQFRQATSAIFPQIVENLGELVRIPSISSQKQHDADLQKSAEKIAAMFQNVGMDTQILTAPTETGETGKPAVVGKLHDKPGQPTVLLYAHHDVQPVGSTAAWQSDPFEPAIRDGRMYGRGASDDGAGVMVHVGALNVLGDERNVNVTVYVEGEEEIGSPSFKNFVQAHREELTSDVIIVADSANWEVGYPAITASLRGVATVDVTVKVTEHQLHSGMYGGPILDAITLASRLIATLHDDQGNVAVAGLGGYDKATVDLDEAEFRQNASLVSSYQLAGNGTIASRLWTKPALSVIGWDQRSLADASNTITAETTFRLSLRTVPGTKTEDAITALSQHLLSHAPFGAEVTVTPLEAGPAYLAKESPAKKLLETALEAAYDQAPLDTGLGGSIPFISDFEDIFPHASVLVTGIEDPHSNAHAENESADLSDLEKNIVAQALLLDELGNHPELCKQSF